MSTKLVAQQEFTLGSDPEMFAKNGVGDFIPCIGKLGGTKRNPLKINTGWVQEDNVMAEFNTVPAKTKKEFLANVTATRDEVAQILLSHGLHVAEVSAAQFKAKHMRKRKCFEFGCDPDKSIYKTLTMFPPKYTRFAGGHLHIGREDVAGEIGGYRHYLIQNLDNYLFNLSVYFDDDLERINYYGMPGKYREKPYGFEYRTMSNWWIWKPEFINTVYELVNLSVHNFREMTSRKKFHYNVSGLLYANQMFPAKVTREAAKANLNLIFKVDPEKLVEMCN